MRCLNIYTDKRITEVGEVFRYLFISLGCFRLVFALGETVWYEKGRKRRIPIFFKKDRNVFFFYCYYLAVAIGVPEVKEDE